MHLRKEIRKRVVDILLGANIPRVGTNVFNFKLQDIERHETPSICVYIVGESASKFTETPRQHTRQCSLVIEIRDTHPNDDGTVSDSVDDLCNIVEALLLHDAMLGTYNHETFGYEIEDTTISNTSYEYDSTDDEYVMHANMAFDVMYRSMDSMTLDNLNALKVIGYDILVDPATIHTDEGLNGEINYDP